MRREASANLRTAGLVVLAVTLFSVSDVALKLLAAGYPTGQIMACRGGMSLVILGAVTLARSGRLGPGPALRDPACWIRGLWEVGVAYCFFTALRHLPLADATAVLFVFPLMLTVLAALVLRERVGRYRWVAVAAGLAGILLILRPGTGAFDPALLWPLAAAACIAGRDLATRFVRPGSPTDAVALLTTGLTTGAGLLTLPLGWTAVDVPGFLGFAASAALTAAAFLALVEGTRAGDVSFTAPFRYVVVPISFVAGWLVWGDVPDGWVLAGTAVVVASGLVVVRDEGRRPTATATVAGPGRTG